MPPRADRIVRQDERVTALNPVPQPHDPFAQFRLARLYLAWARHDPVTRSRDELLQQADQTCARALSDGPYMARTWQGCAEISAERGAADEAAARTARARELTGSL